MPKVAKVAVSLPAKTLQRLESARRHVGRTRSAVVVEAIEHWLDAREVGDDDRRYVEAYLKRPERVEDVAAVASAAMSSWEAWE